MLHKWQATSNFDCRFHKHLGIHYENASIIAAYVNDTSVLGMHYENVSIISGHKFLLHLASSNFTVCIQVLTKVTVLSSAQLQTNCCVRNETNHHAQLQTNCCVRNEMIINDTMSMWMLMVAYIKEKGTAYMKVLN